MCQHSTSDMKEKTYCTLCFLFILQSKLYIPALSRQLRGEEDLTV